MISSSSTWCLQCNERDKLWPHHVFDPLMEFCMLGHYSLEWITDGGLWVVCCLEKVGCYHQIHNGYTVSNEVFAKYSTLEILAQGFKFTFSVLFDCLHSKHWVFAFYCEWLTVSNKVNMWLNGIEDHIHLVREHWNFWTWIQNLTLSSFVCFGSESEYGLGLAQY